MTTTFANDRGKASSGSALDCSPELENKSNGLQGEALSTEKKQGSIPPGRETGC